MILGKHISRSNIGGSREAMQVAAQKDAQLLTQREYCLSISSLHNAQPTASGAPAGANIMHSIAPTFWDFGHIEMMLNMMFFLGVTRVKFTPADTDCFSDPFLYICQTHLEWTVYIDTAWAVAVR